MHIPTGEFAEQTALVTGAAQGIGRAVAVGLARRGAHVIATDLNAEGVHALARELTADGLLCTGHALDVGDAAAVEALIADVERTQPIALLVNVAGVLALGAVTALGAEAWRHTFRVNVDGVFHLCASVARRMQTRRAGAIVNVGSNAAHVPRMEMGAYAASKAAVSMLSKCLALELASDGIRCNVVAPGSTDTPMQRALWSDEQSPARVVAGDLQRYRTGIPTGRIASPDDVVEAVVFLLSSRARQITMQELVVDGGAVLGA